MPRKSNTRAASHSGSIRQRPDGRWEGRVTIGTDPGTGKPIRRSIYGATQNDVRQAMTEDGKTVKNVSAVLHKAFSVAMKQGIISANPCDGAELPKVERHEIIPLTDSEIPRFLAAIESSPMCNAYALCLFAGLREGECLGLSWKQVDLKTGRITISQQLQKEKSKGGKYYIASSTKSGKPRTIEPPEIAMKYL